LNQQEENESWVEREPDTENLKQMAAEESEVVNELISYERIE